MIDSVNRDLASALCAQRAIALDLYLRWSQQVRGPACFEDTLWLELVEAQRKLSELELGGGDA